MMVSYTDVPIQIDEISATFFPTTILAMFTIFFSYCTWEYYWSTGTSSTHPAKPRSGKGVSYTQRLKHLAIIMDGNRRYGKTCCGNRLAGHYHGALKLLDVLNWCIELKLNALTVYAFSTENWKRDKREIDALMKLFEEYFQKVLTYAKQNNVQVHFLVCEKERLPLHITNLMTRIETQTQHNTGLNFNVCVSYGSRSEIVNVCKKIVEASQQQQNTKQHQLGDTSWITEEVLSQQFLTHRYGGDPDLILRTSGEFRMSNFLLWQAAYAELAFIDETWPEVSKERFFEIVNAFEERHRRFGK
eukprot:PhF_6_TR44437/c0_g1_i2/m.68402/K00806/uppS; undecaprenyl diphosphate synthase